MTALPPPTLAELEITATKLVDAILEYRRPNPSRVSTTPKREPEAKVAMFNTFSAGDLMDTDDAVLRLREIVANPIVWSLKRTLKLVGQAIYDQVGSTDALLKVAERIADRDDKNWGRRMSPIDSAWDGVGAPHDRWRA